MKKLPFLSARFLLGVLCLSMCFCAGCSDSDYEIYTAIYGVVSDHETGQPLANASVVLSPSGITKQTGADGSYSFENLDAQQQCIIIAQKAGYQTNRKLITTVSGERMEVNIQLTQIPQ